MTKTPATLPVPYMPTIMEDTGTEIPKTDAEITYLKKKNIDEANRQNFRKKDVYEINMKNIYNILVGQTNEKF